MYQRCKTTTRVTYIDLTKASVNLGITVSRALLGYHAYTGCDSVSSFAGKGKMSGLKLLMTNVNYQNLFLKVGISWNVSDSMFDALQKFTCLIYDANTKCSDVNSLRHEMFVKRKGRIESHQLPPCQDTLYKHCVRANYQT